MKKELVALRQRIEEEKDYCVNRATAYDQGDVIRQQSRIDTLNWILRVIDGEE